MKITGIVGGVSSESSTEYYRLINQEVRLRLGAAHSAELVMYSLDFHSIAQLQLQQRWRELADVLISAITCLQRAGAEFVILASNTLHAVADLVQPSIQIPLLHIADAAAEEINQFGISTVGLLGIRAVMEQDFYKENFEHTR